eukprot:TRINITY_DN9530_c0_g1_i3.p1 TRINITY_DN9530_c0_g1~~TRINITY_DN9530_c0_g1_i3.p1  ORF type:complete len:453 (+),score=95.98 TRINITY_DN9530_c0_g1_i3:56-1414(+)
MAPVDEEAELSTAPLAEHGPPQADSVPEEEQHQEDFEEWVRSELRKSPLREQGFEKLLEEAADAILRMRARLLGSSPDAQLWSRFVKHGRLLKEVNEALPVASRVLDYVSCHASDKPLTVVDLCSGVGYLSALLAELLAARGLADRVARFVLVDKAWPLMNAETKSHHINPAHVRDVTWPTELTYRRYDLKGSAGHRQMAQFIFQTAPGPIVLLGIHLCSVLSLHAVQLFNDHPRCTFLALKPCCLPNRKLARQKFVWKFGCHCIDSRDVCADGQYSKGRWVGAHSKGSQRATFRRWAAELHTSVDAGGPDGVKSLEEYKLLNEESHFQTLVIFAQRAYSPVEGSVSDIGGDPARGRPTGPATEEADAPPQPVGNGGYANNSAAAAPAPAVSIPLASKEEIAQIKKLCRADATISEETGGYFSLDPKKTSRERAQGFLSKHDLSAGSLTVAG